MEQLLSRLTAGDYEFLLGIIQSNVNLSDDARLGRLLAAFEETESAEARAALNDALVSEIRYLGSSELAYFVRKLAGQEPGVQLQEVFRDVATQLKVRLRNLGTDEEMLVDLVEQYATQRFAELPPEEQQELLQSLGVDEKQARGFILRSAGVFALPVMIQTFNAVVVEGLIKQIIFGTIAKIIGQDLARRLFLLLVGRLPWWVKWIGPAAWSVSIGWTAIDLQGPARRKTVPVVLYLGLCAMREALGDSQVSYPERGDAG